MAYPETWTSGKRSPPGVVALAAAASSLAAAILAWMSRTAALMASSASMLQCSFTGGRLRCLAMSLQHEIRGG